MLNRTITSVWQGPISNFSELFSYSTMYLNFMFLDQLLFDLSCKNPNPHTRKHTHTRTDTHTHTHTNKHTHAHTLHG